MRFLLLFNLCISYAVAGQAPVSVVIADCNSASLQYNGVVRVMNSSTQHGCIRCKSCFPGQEPSVQCGSTISIESRSLDITCRSCKLGTYSDSYSVSRCRPCGICSEGKVAKMCTTYSNTVCKSCQSGYYRSFSGRRRSCLPCSRCCGDDKDVQVDECIGQGSFGDGKSCSVQSHLRCSNLTFPIFKIQKNSTRLYPAQSNHSTPPRTTNSSVYLRNSHEQTNFSPLILSVLICITVSITLALVAALKYICFKNSSSKLGHCHCLPTRLSKFNSLSDMCKGDQSDDLEDWAKCDVANSSYLFQCGVIVHYDKSSKQDANKSLVVEVCNDFVSSHLKVLESNQIFLSPIFKFYSQGEKFEKPVQVTLPHSGLVDSKQNNWDIEILCLDERTGKKATWKKMEKGVQVNWNDAGFTTDTLLTYTVVGKPRHAPAKKRMQFVVFAMKEMTSDLFKTMLYFLDDNESSFQRVLKENQRKGWQMLGSFYATFIDCFDESNISIHVDGLLEGWKLVNLAPEVISSQSCADSYFNVPNFQAVFRRIKRRNEKFSCKFIVDIAGSKIIIPAFTIVPQEQLSVFIDVHEDTDMFDRKTRFAATPYDVRYQLCRMLDIPARGLGNWRDVGRHFGLAEDDIENCSLEYATLDGSPSRALLDQLCANFPCLTVGELAKCLDSLGRADVVSVLQKHQKLI